MPSIGEEKPEKVKVYANSTSATNGENTGKEFTEANETDSRVHFETLRIKAENHRGYAEGILQALVCIGFKHERMKELGNLL